MRNKNLLKKSNGFTLIELVVCFVILLILSSASVAGILEYQDYADYKRQNSYAQTLFSAAQTQMTALSVRGQTQEITKASMGTYMLNNKELCYLTGNAETYADYKAGIYNDRNDTISKSYKQLYGLLDSYLYDKEILSAAITIEYDPIDGIVYSVFYSDRVNSFNYAGENGNGTADISARDSDSLRKNMVGYYGGE